jgi:hypothetical protein
MVATPVSTRVNTPKNNDAELIAPAKVAGYGAAEMLSA